MAERTKKPKEKVEDIKVKKTAEEKAAKKEAKRIEAEEAAAKLATPPRAHISKKGKTESAIKFNEPAEGKIWFRKVGRGSLRKIPGCPPIVKPGEKFLARLADIPVSFRNSIVRVDEQTTNIESEEQSVDMDYRIKKLQSGLFNVVNKKAKKMNPKPLSRDAAIELRNELND